jgi:hypothetical protein
MVASLNVEAFEVAKTYATFIEAYSVATEESCVAFMLRLLILRCEARRAA